MKSIIQVVLIQAILTLTLTIGRKDGDEGRPYEFGFTIDGQQHRHEKKDENGIIQGEFGFITADGVYHVTVYATDENGNFKILSMKNIRISAPLDGSPATGPISPEASKYLKSPKASESPSIQQPSRPPPAPSPQFQRLVEPSPVVAVTPKPQTEFTTKPTIKPACAGCGYVTTAKPTTQPAIQQYSSGGSLQSSTGVNQPPRDVELLSPGFRTDNVGPATDFQHPIIGPASNEYQQQNKQSQNFGNQNNNIYTQQQSQDFGNQNNNIYTQQQSQDFGNQNNNIYTQQQTPNVQSISSASINPSSDLLAPNGNVPSNQYQQQGGQGSYPGDQKGAVYKQHQNQFSQPPSSLDNNVIASGGKKQVSDVETDYLASLGNQTHQKEYVELLSNIPDKGIIPNIAGRSSQLNSPPAPTEPSKLPPITVSDNSIHVGGSNPQDIPIQDKFPGMAKGLPEGIGEKDVTDILYKFKYTVGFHGHYEKGLRDGTKIGGYFVNGRDGFSRVVTYVADRNGYRPKFKLVNLGLDSPDTPKEDTEKSFGLKSFEFVWYPL